MTRSIDAYVRTNEAVVTDGDPGFVKDCQIEVCEEAPADTDLFAVVAIKGLVDDDFIIYSGDDSLTLPMMAVGGYGIISVAGHVVGNQIHAMVDAYAAGNVKEAEAMHRKLYPIFKSLFITSNPVPVKFALKQQGFGNGKVRLPLVEANEKEQEAVLKTMKDLELV